MIDDVITDAAGDELEHGAPDFPGQFPEVAVLEPDASEPDPGQFPLGREWMVKTMTDNARLGSPQDDTSDVRGHFPYHEYEHPADHSHRQPATTLPELVAEMRAAWEAYDRDGSRRIDEAIEALERYAKP